MAELIGELAPIAGTDVNNDPSRIGVVRMQPNMGRPRAVIVDLKLLWLLVGEEPDPGQARFPHARENSINRLLGRPVPVASEFQRHGKQR